MAEIQELKKKRFDFLKKVYEVTGGDENVWPDMWEIGSELGYDRELTEKIAQYLDGEWLIEFKAIGGGIKITHRGIVEMEAALENPDRRTDHFPPVNVMYVGQMIGSQVQQAGSGAVQKTELRLASLEEVSALVELLKGESGDTTPILEAARFEISVMSPDHNNERKRDLFR